MIYKIYYQENRKIKNKILEADSLDALKASKEYPLNIIHIKEQKGFKSFDLNREISFFKNYKKLNLELFKQLDIMLSANLTLNSSLKLLLENKQDDEIKKLISAIDYSVQNPHKLKERLDEHTNLIDQTSIFFLKLGIEKGNIKDAVSSLVTILEQDMEVSKKLKDSLRYPMVLIVSIVFAVLMIFLFVIPNFKSIFLSLGANLPFATKVLLDVQSFVENSWGVVLLFMSVFLFIFYIFYQKQKKEFHKILLLHIPYISKFVKSYLYYKLFLSLYIIVKSKYHFQSAIDHSVDMVQNIYLKEEMKTIILKIKKGNSIAESFKESFLFDSITIELLYTAEHTNRYEDILNDLSVYYKSRFQDSIKNFISFFNPFIIFIISIFILWIILAVMMPTWSLSSSL